MREKYFTEFNFLRRGSFLYFFAFFVFFFHNNNENCFVAASNPLQNRYDDEGEALTANVVIFSKDRAAQLDLLFTSLEEYLTDFDQQNIIVIAAASTPDFAHGYRRFAALHPHIQIIAETTNIQRQNRKKQGEFDLVFDCEFFSVEEGEDGEDEDGDDNFDSSSTSLKSPNDRLLSNFRDLVLSSVLPHHLLTTFLVDDLIFKEPFSFSNNLHLSELMANPDVLTYSLRMHPGVSHGVSGPRMEDIADHFPNRPRLDPARGGVWDWTVVPHGDYGYPMSLNAHIFRTEDIIPMLQHCPPFHNPNLLESSLSRVAFFPSRRLMGCGALGVAVNIPANIVQTTYMNENMRTPPSWFNERFVARARLTFHHLRGVRTNSGQSELPLLFHPNNEPSWRGHAFRRNFTRRIMETDYGRLASRDDALHNILVLDADLDAKTENTTNLCTNTNNQDKIFSVAPYFPHVIWSRCLNEDARLLWNITVVVLVDRHVVAAAPKVLRVPIVTAWLRLSPSECDACYASVKQNIEMYHLVFTSDDNLISWGHENGHGSRFVYLPFSDDRRGVFSLFPNLFRVSERKKSNKKDAAMSIVGIEGENDKFKDILPKDWPMGVKDSSSAFASHFSIIASTQENNGYLPNELIICFLKLSVPIYRGPSAAGDVFDLRGMVLFQTRKELQRIVADLQNDVFRSYDSFLPFLQKNKEIALHFAYPLQLVWFHHLSPFMKQLPQQSLSSPSALKKLEKELMTASSGFNSSGNNMVSFGIAIVAGGGRPLESVERCIASVFRLVGDFEVSLLVILASDGGRNALLSSSIDEIITRQQGQAKKSAKIDVLPHISQKQENWIEGARTLLRLTGKNSKEENNEQILAQELEEDEEGLDQASVLLKRKPLILAIMDARDQFVRRDSLSYLADQYFLSNNSNKKKTTSASPWVMWGGALRDYSGEDLSSWQSSLSPRIWAENSFGTAGVEMAPLLSFRPIALRQIYQVQGDRNDSSCHSSRRLLISLLEIAGNRFKPIPIPLVLMGVNNVYKRELISPPVCPAEGGIRRLPAARGGIEPKPVIRILQPISGNYFVNKHAVVAFEIDNMWLPEDGEIRIIIDKWLVYVAKTRKLSLPLSLDLPSGVHHLFVQAVGAEEELLAEETVWFGIM